MTRTNRMELERMLEKAVADAIGVPYHTKPIKRAYRPKAPAAYHAMRSQHSARELQHA